jgi:PadR family transcriptional regulator PadR
MDRKKSSRFLSRAEEMILLAIWRLGNDAYCVPILEEMIQRTGRRWTLSGIYIPLGRLEKNKLVESYFSDPLPARGGKRRRFYRITRDGFAALKEIKALEKSMWIGLPEASL